MKNFEDKTPICKCYYCGSKLQEYDEPEILEIRGCTVTIEINLLYSICKRCGQEVVTNEQILINDSRVREKLNV